MPFATVHAAVVNILMAFILPLAMMDYYRIGPGGNFVLIPLIVVQLTLAALGTGTLLLALNVACRDFRYVIAVLVQLGMLATPTVYMPPEE